MPEQSSQADPSQHAGAIGGNGIPADPNQFIQADILRPLVTDPYVIHNQLLEAGKSEAEAYEQVEAMQRSVAQEVMVPEFMAQASGEAARNVGNKLEELTPVVGVGLESAKALASDVTFHGIQKEFDTSVNPAISTIKALIKGETDPRKVVEAVQQLEAFRGDYSTQVAALGEKTPEAKQAIAIMTGAIEEGSRYVKEVSYHLDKDVKDKEGTPKFASTPEVLKAVEERGADSVQSHRRAAEEDYMANDTMIIAAGQGLDETTAQAHELVGPIKRLEQVAATMPNPQVLNSAVDYLREAVGNAARRGTDDVERALHQLVRVTSDISGSANEGRRIQGKLAIAAKETRLAFDKVTAGPVPEAEAVKPAEPTYTDAEMRKAMKSFFNGEKPEPAKKEKAVSQTNSAPWYADVVPPAEKPDPKWYSDLSQTAPADRS